MKLRFILIILSLLAFVSASASGLFYYNSIKRYSFQKAERESKTRLAMLSKNIGAFLDANVKPVQTLAGLDVFKDLLVQPNDKIQIKAEHLLDLFKTTLKIDVCYIMNTKGVTVATSNRNDPDSFMLQNFGFRPYFTKAIKGQAAAYMALGTTSGIRGNYNAFPIFAKFNDLVIGVAVIKTSIEKIENNLGPLGNEHYLVTDPHGVIFISDRNEWIYHTLQKLSPEGVKVIAASRQFGHGPWNWIGLQHIDINRVVDSNNDVHMIYSTPLQGYEGWNVFYLRNLKTVYQSVSSPLLKITGQLILALCLLIGFSVFFLYRKASNEIKQRKRVEEALRESDNRYRSLYNNTPAMLHSIDPKGHLLSVSNHWLATLGYQREEVIGQKLTKFFTEESRHYAESSAIPDFFKTGNLKDIPYQFIRKDGTIIDILLSAIGVRDNSGSLIRSLAVSIDITQRKKAEEMLKKAKEELSRYSIKLEQQVHKRTEEIRLARDQLRRLSASVMNSQELERAAISRELHDELGQVLTALRLDAAWLNKKLLQRYPEDAERAKIMCDLIDQSIDEIRGIAFRLRPGMLDDLGLVEALDLYATDFERRSNITTLFKHKNVPTLTSTVATAAYRITQEALTNIARHSGANNVEILLQVENSMFRLEIKDNGCGFIVNDLMEISGLGLAGMRERAILAGGNLLVQSSPGNGTSILFKAII